MGRPRGNPMKYLCLVYIEGQKLHAVPDRECKNSVDGFRERGVLLAAEALQPIETATTVRVRNGKVTVTDGPFAETKEQLAGLLSGRRARSERRHPDRREDPAGARGQRRGAAGQRAGRLARTSGSEDLRNFKSGIQRGSRSAGIPSSIAISRSLSFTRRALRGPMRSRCFCAPVSDSRSSSA